MFRLAVSDGLGGAAIDTVNVTVVNRIPIASAGADRNAIRNLLVALDGTGSNDPDGDPLSFVWLQTGGPPGTVAGPDTATPTFTPVLPGTFVFQLTVNDGFGGTDTASVSVRVVNRYPILSFSQTPFENGVDPQTGDVSTVFTFRIVYADPDGDLPAVGYPRLRILQDSVEIAGSPFPLAQLDSSDSNVVDGKGYGMQRTLPAPSAHYTLIFEANDGFDAVETAPINAPDIVGPHQPPAEFAWWIPLALALAVLLFLILALVVRRRRKRRNEVAIRTRKGK